MRTLGAVSGQVCSWLTGLHLVVSAVSADVAILAAPLDGSVDLLRRGHSVDPNLSRVFRIDNAVLMVIIVVFVIVIVTLLAVVLLVVFFSS